jgi:hypothetical protein
MTFTAKGMAEMVLEPRFVGILWGPVGSGKTPLAATAPGRITYLMFDVDGWKTIAHLKHVDVIDLSGQDDKIIDQFENISSVEANLKPFFDDPEQSTLVLDSITSYMDKALTRGIVRVGSTPKERPTNLAPGLRGYGARAMLIRQAVMNLHALCARYGKHFILTAHEKQDLNADGTVSEITMLLGGEAYVQVPKNFSEVWRVSNKDGVTSILTAPYNKYSPCRTRMFIRPSGIAQFHWRFNTYDWTGEGIETWMKQWQEAGCRAIPLPK